MIIGLILASVIFYFIGGERWTKVRDLGCPACIFSLMWYIFGWSWWHLLGFAIAWGGLSLGDDVKGDKWYWTPHAFVTGLCMLPYTIINQEWLCFSIMMVVVTGGTYLVSKFLNRFYADVILRGLLYTTIPLWFLIRS